MRVGDCTIFKGYHVTHAYVNESDLTERLFKQPTSVSHPSIEDSHALAFVSDILQTVLCQDLVASSSDLWMQFAHVEILDPLVELNCVALFLAYVPFLKMPGTQKT